MFWGVILDSGPYAISLSTVIPGQRRFWKPGESPAVGADLVQNSIMDSALTLCVEEKLEKWKCPLIPWDV